MKPLISVIMTVYNAEKYLEETIESILNQSYSRLEFIIVDDDSTDSSPNIVQNYAKKDSRIKFISEGKLGRGSALNYAIKHTKGKFIANIDSDDPSYLERLEKQLNYFDKNPDVVLIGTASDYIDEKGKKLFTSTPPLIHDYIKKSMATGSPFNHSSVMFKKASIESIGFYNTIIPAHIDYDLWVKTIKKYKVANMEEVLCTKRLHEDQYFEQGVIKENYGRMVKNRSKAIKELELSRWNYILLILAYFYHKTPQSLKKILRKIKNRYLNFSQ